MGASRASGLVNAVLRKVPNEPPALDPYRPPDWLANDGSPSLVGGSSSSRRRFRGLERERIPLNETPTSEIDDVFRLPDGTGAVAEAGFSSGDWWVMDAGCPMCGHVVELFNLARVFWTSARLWRQKHAAGKPGFDVSATI